VETDVRTNLSGILESLHVSIGKLPFSGDSLWRPRKKATFLTSAHSNRSGKILTSRKRRRFFSIRTAPQLSLQSAVLEALSLLSQDDIHQGYRLIIRSE
jgi:hypothetical protein